MRVVFTMAGIGCMDGALWDAIDCYISLLKDGLQGKVKFMQGCTQVAAPLGLAAYALDIADLRQANDHVTDLPFM
jgi:hypothetical protein